MLYLNPIKNGKIRDNKISHNAFFKYMSGNINTRQKCLKTRATAVFSRQTFSVW